MDAMLVKLLMRRIRRSRQNDPDGIYMKSHAMGTMKHVGSPNCKYFFTNTLK